MKCIVVMFDSLNRHHLPPYGCDWVHAPNFTRLAKRTVTFDHSYVCSMPCMPARDFHTGRPNFLHRSWGPLEPFDDSMPQMLTRAGVYTHLITDHYHYFEDGGCTYHTKYNTWESFRGQEGDYWIGQVADPVWPDGICRNGGRDPYARRDIINRQHMRNEEDQPQSKTFAAGIDFIRRNHKDDRWLLQIETFDPHEPFFANRKYHDLYPHDYNGPLFDWPPYREVRETLEQVQHLRYQYASLVSMCDSKLGDVLDVMDELDLWKDTMLIVWTDHGYLLGEHDYWAKVRMPFYQEIAHTPFFVWDPRSGQQNQRRQSLVQPAIDLPVTLLEYFGVACTQDMLGKSLEKTIADDTTVRAAALFGVFGGQVNVTDGRHVYMRATQDENTTLYQYTFMPTHMNRPFPLSELQDLNVSEPISWAKNLRLPKLGCPRPSVKPADPWYVPSVHETMLFDVQADPRQEKPLNDAGVESRMVAHLVDLMKQCAAPPEQYARLGLPVP